MGACRSDSSDRRSRSSRRRARPTASSALSKWQGPEGPCPLSTCIAARTRRSTSSRVSNSIFVGDDVITASPGTWAWGPRDVPHGYQVHSERGRHLSLMLPGGFEAFFEEVAAIATPDADPRREISRIAAVAAQYGAELLGPPAPA